MTPESSPSVTPTSQALAECPRCTFIVWDGTKVGITYCPDADIHTIEEYMPTPRAMTLVLPAIDGPGVFLVALKPLNPTSQAECRLA